MMSHRQTTRRTAAALAVALFVLVIAGALALGLTRLLIARHQVQAAHERYLQVVELARAGVDRGIAKWSRSPDYEGETWAVPADELEGQFGATVEITVQPLGDSETLEEITARAVWGEGEHRTQHTRSIVVERGTLVEE